MSNMVMVSMNPAALIKSSKEMLGKSATSNNSLFAGINSTTQDIANMCRSVVHGEINLVGFLTILRGPP